MTLQSTALTVATQLGRVNRAGTEIIDLDKQIKEEIRNTIRFYNRQPSFLTELRGGTFDLVPGQSWYSTVMVTNAESDQALAGRTSLDVDDIILLTYLRENPGPSLQNEPVHEVAYNKFEELFEGSYPTGEPDFYTRYAGQIGIWPTPSRNTPMYWSGTVRPVVPTNDSDDSIWFRKANELIEAGAARRVCSKYLRNEKWADSFAAIEKLQYDNFDMESILKSGITRLQVHEY